VVRVGEFEEEATERAGVGCEAGEREEMSIIGGRKGEICTSNGARRVGVKKRAVAHISECSDGDKYALILVLDGALLMSGHKRLK